MTATSSASATGCCLISNSISGVAAKEQPECVCMCVHLKETERQTEREGERESWSKELY